MRSADPSRNAVDRRAGRNGLPLAQDALAVDHPSTQPGGGVHRQMQDAHLARLAVDFHLRAGRQEGVTGFGFLRHLVIHHRPKSAQWPFAAHVGNVHRDRALVVQTHRGPLRRGGHGLQLGAAPQGQNPQNADNFQFDSIHASKFKN